MMNDHYIEEVDLAHAWGRALLISSQSGRSEFGPLVVSITGFDEQGKVQEDASIRSALDAALASSKRQSVDTVANTIFPYSMWNRTAKRSQLFSRYARMAPRIRDSSKKNRRGVYFERMIAGGPPGNENQLDFALSTYQSRKGVRRSALQLGIFHPGLDHSAAAQLGFPCLQQVTFAPMAEGLALNAFYATQYVVERAYGNYLGLCRLAEFVAHELGVRVARVTCFTGIAECDFGKTKLKAIRAAISSALPEGDDPDGDE